MNIFLADKVFATESRKLCQEQTVTLLQTWNITEKSWPMPAVLPTSLLMKLSIFLMLIQLVSITKLCHLILLVNCEISGSHGGEYEDDRFLGYGAVKCRRRGPLFRRCVLSILSEPSSLSWQRQYAPYRKVGLLIREHIAWYTRSLPFSCSYFFQETLIQNYQ
jgi:hypothetical protein